MLILMGAAAVVAAPAPQIVQLSPIQLFALAARLEAEGRTADAEAAYEALAGNPEPEIRTEARFRHAMLLARLKRLEPAAVLLRRILDDKPDAQRVRLELAAVLAQMGDLNAARTQLRAASAGPLPPDIRALVERSALALRATKPFGGSLSVGLAGDSNINRATSSDTLGTIIGDFTLSRDARETSGTGLRTEGQAYARVPLGAHSLSVSLGGAASLYREKAFNDVSLSLRAGPELVLGRSRLTLAATGGRRWFGGTRLYDSAGAGLDLVQPLDARTQLRLGLGSTRLSNHRNPLEEGWNHGGSASLDRALGRRGAIGASATLARTEARDPAYANWTRGGSLYGYRDLGRASLTLALSASRLTADARIFLYPEVRRDTLLRAQGGLTLRALGALGFAPQVKLTLERNRSSVSLYDYKRRAVELGVTRAF